MSDISSVMVMTLAYSRNSSACLKPAGECLSQPKSSILVITEILKELFNFYETLLKYTTHST